MRDRPRSTWRELIVEIEGAASRARTVQQHSLQVVGLLVALASFLFGAPMHSAVVAVLPAHQVHVYTYDYARNPEAVTDLATERGPPRIFVGTAYDAVDRWSHGFSARLEPSTSTATITYDDMVTLGQVARATLTAQERVPTGRRESCVARLSCCCRKVRR